MTQPGPGEKIEPFERWTERYDAWFDEHRHAYRSELAAVDEVLGEPERAVEVGTGTGRFAAPLGIWMGIEPAAAAARRARSRGVPVARGVGEALPLADGSVDLVLLVTTLCFLDDVDRAFGEFARVLEPGGALVVGFLDRDTWLGETYQERGAGSPFYRPAELHGSGEVAALLEAHGFTVEQARQTLFTPMGELGAPDRVAAGIGEGGFGVVRARRDA